MWKQAELRWELIGDVQMPKKTPASALKHYPGDQMFPEGDYDHVFDVDCGDGVLRKLPFNNGGNWDEAANRFCIKENFSKIHIEQIKQFLMANASKNPTVRQS